MATLLEKVARISNLRRAWDSIRHRPQSKGSDAVTISAFAENLHENLQLIGKALRANKYKFKDLRGHPVPKTDGGIRPLRIPAVSDRVAQKAIQLVIQKPLDKRYQTNNPVSFAYIKGKSATQALKRVRELYIAGYEWIYVADIQKFFDTIPPVKLVKEYVAPVLSDQTLNDLIAEALKTEISNLEEMKDAGFESYFQSGEVGIAQGGILSPLFANVYLHDLDNAMMESEFEMVRYADDFVVMCRSKGEARQAHKLAKAILETQLGLKLHEIGGKKSKIEPFNILEFLGVRFEKDHLFPGTARTKKMLQLLGDFARRPPRKTAIENLIFLRDITSSWASNLFFTDMEPDSYKKLDNGIAYGLVKLMRQNAFAVRKPPYRLENLEKLGIPTFTQRMLAIRQVKKKELIDFYTN